MSWASALEPMILVWQKGKEVRFPPKADISWRVYLVLPMGVCTRIACGLWSIGEEAAGCKAAAPSSDYATQRPAERA